MSWDPWGFMSVVCDAPTAGGGGKRAGDCSMYGKREREGGGEGLCRSIESIMMNLGEGVFRMSLLGNVKRGGEGKSCNRLFFFFL